MECITYLMILLKRGHIIEGSWTKITI